MQLGHEIQGHVDVTRHHMAQDMSSNYLISKSAVVLCC